MKLIYSILFLMVAVLTMGAQATDSVVAENPAEGPAQVADTLPEEGVEEPAAIISGEVLAQQADSAYSADNFVMAEALYLKALEAGGSSSTLFYNLGNAYYRQGNLGKAIVNYERALKLDPTNADARANLEFVNSKITDKQIDSGSYMDSVWEGTVGMFHADTWAIVALVLFAIFLGAIAAYIFSSAVAVKKASFFGGLVVFALTVCAVIVSFAAANRVNSDRYAIILPPSSQLSTSPREARSHAEQAFLLHEGTKVEIIDSIANPGEGMWYEVLVGHGERAWVKASEVERI
ncbi:MAG: tetratricopeptide repeat protein [Muribaculaceae bacterium]|nr:tetratricopeptide repeat protein [Muribaculaceae bacterium]